MTKSWYSVEEVSNLLGISKHTVREKLATKEYKGSKAGREWRIPKYEVNRILGIEQETNEKDVYIKELEKEIKYLRLQVETFKKYSRFISESN